MVTVHGDWPNQMLRLAPPKGTPEHDKYVRYVALYGHLQERIAARRQQLDQLQSHIAACLCIDSPEALDAAVNVSEQIVDVTADIAQLHFFVAHYALRLQSLRQFPRPRSEH